MSDDPSTGPDAPGGDDRPELRVEVYSDYTCPWCYVGLSRLDRLRERLEGRVELDVTWRPFEIHPEVPEEGMPVEELSYSEEQWERMMEELRRQAEAEGLEVGERPKVSNTHEALMAGAWAQAERPERFEAFHRALFRAYFAEGRDLGDRAVLRGVAERVGLDGDELEAALAEGAGEGELEATAREARRLGITGTPTFVFGGTHAAVGARPTQDLRRAAEQALQERNAGGLA